MGGAEVNGERGAGLGCGDYLGSSLLARCSLPAAACVVKQEHGKVDDWWLGCCEV